ncbi:MAG: GNAT family N-acetyltransferase [Alistipes sp.]|nr:GNAT family N-acetyltransferase [Alistipes sp.]
MNIYRTRVVTTELVEALKRLLPQLSSSAQTPDAESIEKLLKNDNTHLFVAEEGGVIAGMLTLAVVELPTGRKAWIEDVVVDAEFRGIKIGEALVEKAKEEATAIGAKKLYLTSNPSRKAAHALYAKCGFEVYDTTLFRIAPQKK